MKTCKYCQAELPDEEQVCPACGRSQAEEAAEAVQPTEEAAVETPAEAGAPVTEPEAVTAPAEAAEAETEEASAPAEPAEEAPAPKATPGKIALAVAAVVVLLAALIALVVTGLNGGKEEAPAETDPSELSSATIDAVTEPAEATPPTVPEDGEKGTVQEKGSYSASDEDVKAARDTVVATTNGAELTNADLQVYYWMEVHSFLSQYGAYAAYFGLDYTQPLDTQPALEGDMTWQQYFLRYALDNWQQIQAMSAEAKKAGLPITAEDQAILDNLEADLTKNAQGYNVTLEELLYRNIGPGAGFDDYAKYMRDFRQGVPYYNAQLDSFQPTEQELSDFFDAHAEGYADQGITRDTRLVDVRHILLQPQGGTADENGQTTFSDEEWAACEAEAQALLDTWLAGAKTEDSFAALAGEHSTDPGSKESGGLYENVEQGQMVDTFDAWCFDEGRSPGDTGLVKTSYGYHIMYFVDSRLQWKTCAENDWTGEQVNAMLDRLAEEYPLTVDYSKILLGEIPSN